MKKRYIFIFMSIIMTIAYFDLVDSCNKIDKIISSMIQLDSKIKTEIDTSGSIYNKLVKMSNKKE